MFFVQGVASLTYSPFHPQFDELSIKKEDFFFNILRRLRIKCYFNRKSSRVNPTSDELVISDIVIFFYLECLHDRYRAKF